MLRYLDFAPERPLFAAGNADNEVVVFDLAADRITHRLKVPGKPLAVRFSADGANLAVNLRDRVEVWDVNAGEITAQYEPEIQRINCLAWRPGSDWLAMGETSGLIRLWRPATGEILEFRSHDKAVDSVVFSPDGGLLASTDSGGSQQLWDIASRRTIVDTMRGSGRRFSRDGKRLEDVEKIAMTPDGRLIAVSGYYMHSSAGVRVLDGESGEVVHQIPPSPVQSGIQRLRQMADRRRTPSLHGLGDRRLEPRMGSGEAHRQ